MPWFHEQPLLGAAISIWSSHPGRKHDAYRFVRGTEYFMQHVGKQGGYEVKLGGLSSTPPELVVECLGHCQSVGNCNFTHSRKFQSIANTWTPRQVPITQAAKSRLPAVWWAASG